jgi:hypothetical protein
MAPARFGSKSVGIDCDKTSELTPAIILAWFPFDIRVRRQAGEIAISSYKPTSDYYSGNLF